jgi:hypothetical protein
MNPFKHIVSTKTVAKLLGKSERQVRNMCRDGKLTAQLLDPTDPKSPWMIYYPNKGES